MEWGWKPNDKRNQAFKKETLAKVVGMCKFSFLFCLRKDFFFFFLKTF